MYHSAESKFFSLYTIIEQVYSYCHYIVQPLTFTEIFKIERDERQTGWREMPQESHCEVRYSSVTVAFCFQWCACPLRNKAWVPFHLFNSSFLTTMYTSLGANLPPKSFNETAPSSGQQGAHLGASGGGAPGHAYSVIMLCWVTRWARMDLLPAYCIWSQRLRKIIWYCVSGYSCIALLCILREVRQWKSEFRYLGVIS